MCELPHNLTHSSKPNKIIDVLVAWKKILEFTTWKAELQKKLTL